MGKKPFKRCYENHLDLQISKDIKITGGSCAIPLDGYDIYIGFDWGMYFDEQSYPWTKGESFLYHIKDQCAPKDVKTFKGLINWTEEQLKFGKSVHVGCVGGHGRTGLFLSALYTQMTGNKDSITHVRKNYCKQAVETKEQVVFLNEHYGIKKQEPSKKTIYVSKGNRYSTESYNSGYFPNFGRGNTYYPEPKGSSQIVATKLAKKPLKIIRIKHEKSDATLVKK